jgi:PAS domain S-box-containing protein
MLNASTELVMFVDLDGKFLDLNELGAQLLGLSRQELIGVCIWDLLPPKVTQLRKGVVDRVRETGEAVFWEDEIHGRVFRNSAYALKDADGQVTGVVVYASDITESKELESKVAEYHERVTKLQKAAYVDSMVAAIAHELNQPLTVLNLLLTQCKDELVENTLVWSMLDKCLVESERATNSFKRLRSYMSETLTQVSRRLNVMEIIENIVSDMRQKAIRRNLSISVKIDSPDKIAFDELPLEQILFIIIQNAIDASSDGKKHNLEISAKTSDRTIELRFVDDCNGIAPENMDKIFEPLFSTKKDKGNLGLGLEIVQRIVVQYGGDIRVQSELGKGSTFHVILPLEGG